MRQTIFGLAALVALLCASGADAAVITFHGSGGNPESPGITLLAEATFDTDTSGVLKITLTNTGTYDAMRPTDLLTALFFSIEGDPDPVLSPTSAILAPGSLIYLDGEDVTSTTGTDVSGEWAYKAGLSGAPHDATRGISASGFDGFSGEDMFGPFDLFGPHLYDPKSPNGLDFGIVSAGDDPASGNGGLVDTWIIKNSVVFTLGVPGDFELTDVYNVSFQYGTDLEEGPNTIPEPATLVIWSLLGLCFAGACRWRRRGGDIGRGGRRSAWSEDSVRAIHQIIDRGRLSR